MDPHVALEWEWSFAFGNVKTFDTLATMNRVKAGSEPPIDGSGVLRLGESRARDRLLLN